MAMEVPGGLATAPDAVATHPVGTAGVEGTQQGPADGLLTIEYNDAYCKVADGCYTALARSLMPTAPLLAIESLPET